jgi:hypothetical protein
MQIHNPPSQGNQSIAAGIPIDLRVGGPPSFRNWMQFPARTPNPPPGQGNQSIAAGIPIDLRVGAPPSFRNWMQFPARTPNPPPGQGNQAISAAIPTRLAWGGSGMQAVGRRPNPASLSGWYSSTSTADVAQHGQPNVVGPWVEQLEPKLPAMGLLHRKGQPDVRVQIMWNAGCQVKPGGSHLCTVFVQELGPADMVRYRLPNGFQGRAQKHRVYRTPGGQVTANPLAIENVVTVKKAWLPASYNETKPSGIAGTWVQVSPADARVGLVRVPGGEPQQAFVFQVRKDGQGRLRAQVQWSPQPPRSKNPRAAYLVHTGIDGIGVNGPTVRHDIVQANPPRRRRPVGTIRATARPTTRGSIAPAGHQGKIDPCAWNYWGKKCQGRLAALCPPGTEWVKATQQCRPAGNPGIVSAAAARASVNKSGVISDVASGRKRIVLDSSGVSLKVA